jgi:hypothetical protein
MEDYSYWNSQSPGPYPAPMGMPYNKNGEMPMMRSGMVSAPSPCRNKCLWCRADLRRTRWQDTQTLSSLPPLTPRSLDQSTPTCSRRLGSIRWSTSTPLSPPTPPFRRPSRPPRPTRIRRRTRAQFHIQWTRRTRNINFRVYVAHYITSPYQLEN